MHAKTIAVRQAERDGRNASVLLLLPQQNPVVSACWSIICVFMATSFWSWVVAALVEEWEQLHRIAAPHHSSWHLAFGTWLKSNALHPLYIYSEFQQTHGHG